VRRSLRITLAVGLLLLVSGCALLGVSLATGAHILRTEQQQRHVSATGVRGLDIDVHVGSVTVTAAGRPATIGVRLRGTNLYSDTPWLHVTVDRGVLRVRAGCNGLQPIGGCATSIRLTVPAGLDLHIRSGAGHVRLAGAFRTVDAQSGAGAISGTALRAATLRAETGASDVHLDLVAPTLRLQARSGAGDVVVAVPPGVYAITAHSGAGEAHVVGLRQSPAAERTIVAESGAGDVTVRAR
jgi:hypothetical protein